MKGKMPHENLAFRRYKVIIMPIDDLLLKTSGNALIELIKYFLRFSTLRTVENVEDKNMNTLPFKCIGMV